MNLYFLVEGRRTEMKLYPRWLRYLLPHYSRVAVPQDVTSNSYYLISGAGYPHLLDEELPNAIQNIIDVGRFEYLILCVDADDVTVEERTQEVEEHLHACKPPLPDSTTFKLIVQNRCIETWLLGNRTIVQRHPDSRELRDYIEFHDVRSVDPEQMPPFEGFDTHASFHLSYLQEIFQARGLQYGKYNPGHAGDKPYLNEIIKRTEDRPDDLQSFQAFLKLIRTIASLTGSS